MIKAKFLEKKEIAKDILEITFERGSDLVFEAGQFCKLTLINPPYTDERSNGRYLGFTSSPSQKDRFSFATRKGVSAFKKSLMELAVGKEVEISEIEGRVNKLPEDKSQKLVFVAGDIGISPIMSVIRYSKERSWPYDMSLVYAAQDRESAAFLDELESLANEEKTRFHLITTITNDPSWNGEKRNIDASFIKEYFPSPENYVFAVTGTPKFVPFVFREIKASGVPIANLKMEMFTGY